ncbi:B-cell receptor CD22-like [Esox lucius]|uniref:B-cell receptor CD22-like n=1 Tax=Esox lucius TaxID=8010 RepID=UPI001476F8C6|nr:B-cell receptor CD22-like [Esox lucius]
MAEIDCILPAPGSLLPQPVTGTSIMTKRVQVQRPTQSDYLCLSSDMASPQNMFIIGLFMTISPKDTSASISPAVPVSVGSCVNLTCSSTANPPVTNYTWFRISGGKSTQVASRQNYTLNVTVGDEGPYYCEARNDHGFGKSKELLLSILGQGNSKIWWIFGGTLVLVLLILLIAFFGRRKQPKILRGLEQTDNPFEQVYANQVNDNQMYANHAMTRKPAEVADQSEEIHYGVIDFSKQQPDNTPAAAQDRDQLEETEYSEVKGTRRWTQVQEPPVNELYAQVKSHAI